MLPSFLVVGAAKAGTTSIYRYLQQHPSIYMPRVKESHYFSGIRRDEFRHGTIYGRDIPRTLSEYEQRFSAASPGQVIGEACVSYLYYPRAPMMIKAIIPDAKIVIILRDPSERAFSNYLHHVRDGVEPLTFEDALAKEPERAREGYWWGYQYRGASFYFESVKRYLEIFSHSRVKVFLFEELQQNPRNMMEEMFRFLGVDDTFAPKMQRYNVSGIPRSIYLQRFLTEPSQTKAMLSRLLPASTRRDLRSFLRRKNLRRPQMKASTRQLLKSTFRSDVERLQNLVGRDLTSWNT